MTTIRIAKRRRFTQIDRETVNDRGLSFRARGILSWLLDKPDDWETNGESIAAASDVEGRDAVRTAMSELEAAGYLRLARWRGPDGRFHSQWTVFERPNATEPDRISRAGDPPAADAANATEPDRISRTGQPGPVNQERFTRSGFPGRITDTETDTETKTVIDTETEEVLLRAACGDAGKDASKSASHADLWAAFTEALGNEPQTKSERGGRNSAIRELLEIGATADQVRAKARAYHRTHPDWALTAPALVRHWSELGALSAVPPTSTERAARRACDDCDSTAMVEQPDGRFLPCTSCNAAALAVTT